MNTFQYDVIVIGSGPGGASAAKNLSLAGKKVLILEKGKYYKSYKGSYKNTLLMLDRFGFFKSLEKVNMLKVSAVGGATMLYSGSAAEPPLWLKEKYNIDLTKYSKEISKELNISILPGKYLGKASSNIMEAGNRLGHEWEPMPKFINLNKVKNNKISGAKTSIGENFGERWTALEYIEEAVKNGAKLLTSTECTELIVENGVIKGVKAKTKKGRENKYFAKKVVLSGGGIPSPVLLQKAGIKNAGKGCIIDPTILVYGISKNKGTYKDPLVSVVSWKWYESDGIRLGTFIDPPVTVFISLAKSGIKNILKILKYPKMVGILVKIKDELGGYVDEDGNVSKELTISDMKKIEKGIKLAEQVLIESGCSKDSIVRGEIRGAHPGGTCRILNVVDKNLETEIKNLFVCDASIFPEALDRPTVLTILSFGKRLSDYIIGS
ncbi:MAG: GMC family oxidoreductase N-terminal domain-containing protein [Desulforegulaceae bacterium]|nr:GMC family oxidoreductase N-terminal domain-containing protein [Desulforegulaceae bacterium]